MAALMTRRIVHSQHMPHVSPNTATGSDFNDPAPKQKYEAEMAYVNSRSTTVTFADRVSSALKLVKDAIARRQLYNSTLAELNALTDRELSDLGLARANIADIAREATYVK
jgi:uncharacterized protein YjiS (DUF1127 family)